MAIVQALSMSRNHIDYAQASWTPNSYLSKTRHVFQNMDILVTLILWADLSIHIQQIQNSWEIWKSSWSISSITILKYDNNKNQHTYILMLILYNYFMKMKMHS